MHPTKIGRVFLAVKTVQARPWLFYNDSEIWLYIYFNEKFNYMSYLLCFVSLSFERRWLKIRMILQK